jgi:hypothetical protein
MGLAEGVVVSPDADHGRDRVDARGHTAADASVPSV